MSTENQQRDTTPEPPQSGDVVQKKESMITIIEDRQDQIQEACIGRTDFPALFASFKKSVSASPKLMSCTPQSVLDSIFACAKLDLDPTGEHNSAWLIPYWNRDLQANECKLMIGYGGYIDLITRGGEYRGVYTEVVYPGETFRVIGGTSAGIEHEIDPEIRNTTTLTADNIVAAYAVADRPDGSSQFMTLSRSDIIAAKNASQNANGPWKYRFAEMVKKSSVRSLAKWLRMGSLGRLATAISDEGDGYAFDPSRMKQVQNTATSEDLDEVNGRIDALTQAVAASGAEKGQAPGRDATGEEPVPSEDGEAFGAEMADRMEVQG
jgi:phage RecT family recombinase